MYDLAVTELEDGSGLLLHQAACPAARAEARAGKPVMTMFDCERLPTDMPWHDCLSGGMSEQMPLFEDEAFQELRRAVDEQREYMRGGKSEETPEPDPIEELEVPPDGHVGPSPERLIREAFLRFHEENPQVYETLVEMSRRLLRAGQSKLSINMLFEVLRYRHALRTRGDEFKLNNNYRAEYARKLMRENEDLFGKFEIRKLHGPAV